MSEETFEPTSLNAVMGDDTPEEQEQEAAPEPEKVVEAAPEKQEQENAKEEKSDAEPVDAKQDKQDNVVAMRKIIAEQSARLKELEKAPPAEAPDVLDDPEGFKNHLSQEFNAKFVNMSEAMAKSQFSDYDEVATRFYNEVENNPAIVHKIRNAAHPALELYNEGKKLLAMDNIGDPVQYEAKIEARIRAKVEAELKEKLAGSKALADSLPDDLTSATNVGDRKGPAFTRTSLEDIL